MTADRPPNNLRALREAAGLTQRELAERLDRDGVSATEVSRWERSVVIPSLPSQRLLAEALGATVEQLGFLATPRPKAPTKTPIPNFLETYVPDPEPDPRVLADQDEWRQTRAALNANRAALTAVAASVYQPSWRLGETGLLAAAGWIPRQPVDLSAIKLEHHADAPAPLIDGTETQTEHVRPRTSLVRRYPRYTHAIRDLARPRLFENRMSWRLTDLEWTTGGGHMGFADTTYFAGVDTYEVVAHELPWWRSTSSGSGARSRRRCGTCRSGG